MEMYNKDSIDDLESVVCSFVCLPRRKGYNFSLGMIIIGVIFFSKCELIFY